MYEGMKDITWQYYITWLGSHTRQLAWPSAPSSNIIRQGSVSWGRVPPRICVRDWGRLSHVHVPLSPCRPSRRVVSSTAMPLVFINGRNKRRSFALFAVALRHLLSPHAVFHEVCVAESPRGWQSTRHHNSGGAPLPHCASYRLCMCEGDQGKPVRMAGVTTSRSDPTCPARGAIGAIGGLIFFLE